MDDVVHQQKLILNYKTDTSDSLYRSPGDEFDLEFETSFALEPDFKYYDTHEFHLLKEFQVSSFKNLFITNP